VLLDTMIASAATKEIEGRKAFELYDTMVFPIDLNSLNFTGRVFLLMKKDLIRDARAKKPFAFLLPKYQKEDWTLLSKDAEQDQFVG